MKIKNNPESNHSDIPQTEIDVKTDELKWLLNSLLNAFVIFDPVFDKEGKFISYRFVYINKAYETITGVKNDAVKGKTIHEVWPKTEPSWVEKYGHVSTTGETLVFNNYHEPTKKVYHCRVFKPWKDSKRFCVVFDDITECQKSEIELKQGEKKYKNLITTMMNAFGLHEMIFDDNGKPVDYRFLEVNPVWEKVVGIKAESVIGKTIKEIMPNIEESWIEFYGKIVKTGISDEFEEYNKTTNKYYNVYAYRPEEGKFAVFFNDITDRKLIEIQLTQEKEKAERYLDLSCNIIVSLDTQGNISMMNQYGLDLLEYTKDELIGRDWFKTCLPEKDHKEIRSVFNRIISGKISKLDYYENEIITKSGTSKTIAWHNTITRNDEGTVTSLLSAGMDITEKKIAVDNLEENEKKYRLLTDNSIDVIWKMDLKLKFTYVNPSIFKMTGYTPEEWVGTYLHQHATKNEFLKMSAKAFKAIKTYKNFEYVTFEAMMLTKDNREIPVEIIGKLILNKNGLPIGLQGSTRDISERKSADQLLRKSEEKYRFLVENQNDLLVSFDTKKKTIVFANPKYCKVFGVTQEEIYGKQFFPLIHKDDQKAVQASIDSLAHPPYISYHEERAKTIDGWRWLAWSLKTTFDEKGEVKQNISVGRDITDRKLAEMQVEQLSRFPKENPNPVLRISSEGKIVYHNPAAKDILPSFGIDENKKVNAKWENIIHNVLLKKQTELIELKINDRFFDLTIAPILEHGYVNLYFDDKTKRTRALEAQKEGEEKYRNLFETMDQGVVYQNSKGEIISINPAAEKILGISLDQMMGRKSIDPRWKAVGQDKKDLPGEKHPAMIALKTREKVQNFIQGIYNPKLEDYVWIIVTSTPLFNKNEKTPYGVYSTFLDITDRVKAETELQESESKLSALFKNMNEGFALHEIVTDNKGKPIDYIYLDMNPEFEKLTGLKKNKTLGKKVTEVIPGIKEDSVNWIKRYGKVAQENITLTFEDYSEPLNKWYFVSAFSPKKGQFATTIYDITDRKSIENELLQLKNELEEKVKEQTKKLNEKITDLERFHDATINREFRIKELRDEIETLKVQIK